MGASSRCKTLNDTSIGFVYAPRVFRNGRPLHVRAVFVNGRETVTVGGILTGVGSVIFTWHRRSFLFNNCLAGCTHVAVAELCATVINTNRHTLAPLTEQNDTEARHSISPERPETPVLF